MIELVAVMLMKDCDEEIVVDARMLLSVNHLRRFKAGVSKPNPKGQGKRQFDTSRHQFNAWASRLPLTLYSSQPPHLVHTQ